MTMLNGRNCLVVVLAMLIPFFVLAGRASAENKKIDISAVFDPVPTPASFAVGDNTPKATGKLKIDPVKPAHQNEAGSASPTYSWSVPKIEIWNASAQPAKYEALSGGALSACHITINTTSSHEPAVTAWFEAPGKYRVWFRGSMSYSWEGDVYSGTTDDVIDNKNDDPSCELTAVGIEKIVVNGVTPEDEGPTTVLKGNNITLLAKISPASASYPSGKPVWTIESQPSGSTLLNPSSAATATFSPAVDGQYTVKATCGSTSDTFVFLLY